MTRFHLYSAVAVYLFLPALVLAAVPSDDTAQLQGEVTVNGKPIPKGKITFHQDKVKPLELEIKDGSYLLKDLLPVGEWQVTIEFAGGPKKYTEPKTSALSVKVAKGKRVLNLNLDSSPADEKTPIPKTGKVEGRVTLKGKSLEKRTILFHPTNGKPIKLGSSTHVQLMRKGRRSRRPSAPSHSQGFRYYGWNVAH